MPGRPARPPALPVARPLLPLLLLLPALASAASFDLTDAPLRRAIREIAEAGALNVVVDSALPDVPVTMRLEGVEPEDALELLAKGNGMTLRRVGNAFALHPAGRVPAYGERAFATFPVRNEPETLLPALRVAFPALSLSACPGAILAAGELPGPERARLEELIGRIDRLPAAVDFRLDFVTAGDAATRSGGIRAGIGPDGKPFLQVDPEALGRGRSAGRSAASFSGRALAGHDFALFKGSEIPRVVNGSLLTGEIGLASVGDALRVRVVSASEEAITLDLSLDVSSLLPGRHDAAVSARRLDTTVTLVPGRPQVVGGLADASASATLDPEAIVRRLESGAETLLVTMEADLAR